MKKLFVIIALTIVSVVSALAQSPTATTSAAQAIKAGESFTVTVNISKLDLSCFAQYQVKLPEGFTARKFQAHPTMQTSILKTAKCYISGTNCPSTVATSNSVLLLPLAKR